MDDEDVAEVGAKTTRRKRCYHLGNTRKRAYRGELRAGCFETIMHDLGACLGPPAFAAWLKIYERLPGNTGRKVHNALGTPVISQARAEYARFTVY
jgi:hypothetical protein